MLGGDIHHPPHSAYKFANKEATWLEAAIQEMNNW